MLQFQDVELSCQGVEGAKYDASYLGLGSCGHFATRVDNIVISICGGDNEALSSTRQTNNHL